AWRDEVLAEEERDQHKLDRKIVNEEHWLRYGVSGRRKRNVKRLGNLYALREQRRSYRGAAGDANLAAAEADKSGKLVIEAKNIGRSYGDRKIVNEEHWLRYGVSGRRKRNVKRLGNLYALRDQRRDYRGAAGNANLAASEADKSGKLIIEAKHIGRTYGDRRIVDDFSIRVQRGDRIGIVGPNGAGKTTLIDMLTGAHPPDTGTIRFGANIEMATLDQHRESLDPKSTLADALTGGGSDNVMVGGKPKHVVSYMKDFLFAQEQMRTPLEVLSGGERGRLMLARALAKPSNLLVLDEPTNDLDLETLDVLEEMLGDYEGTVILISHDRDFLDRVVTSVIAPEGDGRWIEYAGGYTDMLKQRGGDLKREAVRAAAEEKKELKADAPSGTAKRRLNFNEKHALETLPKTIAKLQAEIAKQQRHLDDPNLYKKDRKKFDQASDALTKAQKELQEAEDKWLELEVLREEIEQA
ncbi:MAG TPA: ATP-binding cassette domain-containing protein, partial [Bradyrhizobium sp.]|nr:ATP-binding cassette domain-containing protein [Bradyrhizobium sp.]